MNYNNYTMNIVQKLHLGLVFPRRTERLSSLIADILPENSTILDVGCGDGIVDALIIAKRPDIKITGVDVLKRKKAQIPVTIYDGGRLPFPNQSFDCIMFIDTLHHAHNSKGLLEEAKRVTKKNIIIKDHYADNSLSFFTLRFMDWVGNKFYRVNLPYNYYSKKQWDRIFLDLNLKKVKEINKLNLYPFPFNLIFERDYHFIINLIKIESL